MAGLANYYRLQREAHLHTTPHYARFEASNAEICMIASAVLDNCVITLSVADVSKTFKQVNIHKAAGPDGLPGRVLTNMH